MIIYEHHTSITYCHWTFGIYLMLNIIYHQSVPTCSKHIKHLLIRNRVTFVMEMFSIEFLQLLFGSLELERLARWAQSDPFSLLICLALFFMFLKDSNIWHPNISEAWCLGMSLVFTAVNFNKVTLYCVCHVLYCQNGWLNLVFYPMPFCVCQNFNSLHNCSDVWSNSIPSSLVSMPHSLLSRFVIWEKLSFTFLQNPF